MTDTFHILTVQFDHESRHGRELTRILETCTGLPPIQSTVCDYRATTTESLEAACKANRFLGLLLTARQITEKVRSVALRCRPAILLVDQITPAQVVEFLKNGISDILTAPPTEANTLPSIWRLLERRDTHNARAALKQEVALSQLVGQSDQFLTEIRKIPLAAKCDASVLITGETGTGKELFARAIHYLSPRQNGPFTPVNCGAIPADLVENELFGHCAGAFTGATVNRPGLIEETEGGTLFLDEIDSLPPAAQVKVLRLLQEKEYRPLGSAKTRTANVRVVSACNSNLEEAILQGRVRHDLYYRLNVLSITLPPLRARRTDIPGLARHLLAKHRPSLNPRVQDFTPDSLEALTCYDWPGNVRELENVVQRALAHCEAPLIGSEHLALPGRVPPKSPAGSFREAKAAMVLQFEKTYLERLLAEHNGNISAAARTAQKDRRALFQLLRKYQISVNRFRVI